MFYHNDRKKKNDYLEDLQKFTRIRQSILQSIKAKV